MQTSWSIKRRTKISDKKFYVKALLKSQRGFFNWKIGMNNKVEHSNHEPSPIRGVMFMIIQTILLVCIGVLVKMLTANGHSPIEISFCRSAIMIVPLLIIMRVNGSIYRIKTANIKSQILRGATGTITMLLMFFTYYHLPLAEAQILFFTTPLFVIALSWPILKEKVGIYRACATLLGFAGVALMLQPGSISSLTGAIFGLASAFGMCCVTLLLRTLGRTQDPWVTIFFFALVGMIMLAPIVPFYWSSITFKSAILLSGVSFLALANQYFLTRALIEAPPSITSPISYISLLWAVMFDFMIWSQSPAALTLFGALIVISANLFILYREYSHKSQGIGS